jgi:aminoglycoside phosphotransferase (APT) family kinase protein
MTRSTCTIRRRGNDGTGEAEDEARHAAEHGFLLGGRSVLALLSRALIRVEDAQVTVDLPTPETAAAAARAATGRVPVAIRRFRTGAMHYVFEVSFDGGAPVVIRMGTLERRAGMADGIPLNRRLRAVGVPLPKVLALGVDDPCPWVAFERLLGTDLGDVIGSLTDRQLRSVAEAVAAAQAAAALVGASGRYGYAAAAEDAPCASWSEVLEANIARSRRRIAAAGLFAPDPVERMAALVAARREALNALPAIAFLHDTTTRNVIVSPEGRLSGIVDVDDLCFGDPRYTAALTLAVLLARQGPVAYVEHWMRAAGQEDDGLFRLYVAMFLVDLIGEHGQRFNGNAQRSTPQQRARLLRAFDIALHEALSRPVIDRARGAA